MRMTELALQIRREVNSASADLEVLQGADAGRDDPGGVPRVRRRRLPAGRAAGQTLLDSWDNDEFALDPTRLTITCGAAGFDGTQFKNLLANRFDVQLNKTSRNSVLIQTNINNTRSDAAHLISVLAELAAEVEQQQNDRQPRTSARRSSRACAT